jgi:PIN domain nuclease of toxin-antitoxin system
VIVLDTHALVWWVSEDKRLSPSARAAITQSKSAGDVLVSAFSFWEISLLVTLGRLAVAPDLTSWLWRVYRIVGLRIVPVDHEIAVQSVLLPGEFHKDPADRLIVATAMRFSVPVVSADHKIRSYPHVETIW